LQKTVAGPQSFFRAADIDRKDRKSDPGHPIGRKKARRKIEAAKTKKVKTGKRENACRQKEAGGEKSVETPGRNGRIK